MKAMAFYGDAVVLNIAPFANEHRVWYCTNKMNGIRIKNNKIYPFPVKLQKRYKQSQVKLTTRRQIKET